MSPSTPDTFLSEGQISVSFLLEAHRLNASSCGLIGWLIFWSDAIGCCSCLPMMDICKTSVTSGIHQNFWMVNLDRTSLF